METELEMARRDVIEVTGYIARQHEIIEELEANGQPADMAAELLAKLNERRDELEARLRQLLLEQQRDVGAAGRGTMSENAGDS